MRFQRSSSGCTLAVVCLATGVQEIVPACALALAVGAIASPGLLVTGPRKTPVAGLVPETT